MVVGLEPDADFLSRHASPTFTPAAAPALLRALASPAAAVYLSWFTGPAVGCVALTQPRKSDNIPLTRWRPDAPLSALVGCLALHVRYESEPALATRPVCLSSGREPNRSNPRSNSGCERHDPRAPGSATSPSPSNKKRCWPGRHPCLSVSGGRWDQPKLRGIAHQRRAPATDPRGHKEHRPVT